MNVIFDICEICGFNNSFSLHKHHIIPRSLPYSSDHSCNIALICANCHMQVHAGQIIIEGRFLTTSGNKLFYHFNGELPKIANGIELADRSKNG